MVNHGFHEEAATGQRALTGEDSPVRPYGCHWFRDCGLCRWDDCLVRRPQRYDSVDGRMLRAAGLATMVKTGIPPEWLSSFFYLTDEQVAEQIAPFLASTRMGSQLNRETKREGAIRRRQNGESEYAVAMALNVSPRQVRRWCSGVAGIQRHTGNRSRGQDLLYKLVSAAESGLMKECAIVRSYFE